MATQDTAPGMTSADRADFLFREAGLFVIPVEHLGPDGIAPDFAAVLVARHALDAASLGLFQSAFRQYWQRATTLHARSPAYFPPPRCQHVCVVSAPDEVRPYFQPFHKSSWLVYRSDFDPAASSVEFATYQFMYAERLGLLRQILPALGAGLAYFTSLSPLELADFCAGCRRTIRADAGGWRALADALDTLVVYHVDLRPPAVALPGAQADPDSGLIVPQAAADTIAALEGAWADAAQTAVSRHVAAHARPAPAGAGRIAQWLADTAPLVVITGPQGEVLWDPRQPRATKAFVAAANTITASAEASVMADLAIVGDHSRRFLSSLAAPESLAEPAAYITPGGLSYIHRESRLVAYGLGGPEYGSRLRQPAPPYERLMLGARTVHEWGHLAAESDLVRIVDRRAARRIYTKIAREFDEALAAAPRAITALTAVETARLQVRHGGLGRAMARGLATRLEDYMANVLARRLLTQAEMETYVRNNVASHFGAYPPEAIYSEIMRHAYEAQYLPLAGIQAPGEWLAKSAWVEERFIATGAIGSEGWHRLLSLVADLCALVAIDTDRFVALPP